MASQSSSPQTPPCEALRQRFQTYGWEPQSHLSKDENYLDLVLLLTRNSSCRDGGMGCVLTSDNSCTDFFDSILGVATNLPFYSANDSDIHAEIAALGQAARQGHATENCTAYITMPPCKRCLAALTMAGVKRLVYFRKTPSYLEEIAKKHAFQLKEVVYASDNKKRVEAVIAKYYKDNDIDDQEEIAKAREKRRQENQERKNRRRIALGIVPEESQE